MIVTGVVVVEAGGIGVRDLAGVLAAGGQSADGGAGSTEGVVNLFGNKFAGRISHQAGTAQMVGVDEMECLGGRKGGGGGKEEDWENQ